MLSEALKIADSVEYSKNESIRLDILEVLSPVDYINVCCPRCSRFLYRFKASGLLVQETKCRSCKSTVETVSCISRGSNIVITRVVPNTKLAAAAE